MKQYRLDTNVLLDLLLNHVPWAADAAVLWDAHRQGQIKLWIAAFSLPCRKSCAMPVSRRYRRITVHLHSTSAFAPPPS